MSFVLGNGVSRAPLTLANIKQYGTIYGCNALYREFVPDYLVAVDTKMVVELNEAGFQHQTSVWTNPNKTSLKFTGFNIFKPSKGWSSGPTALHLASEHKPKEIYILGFDYVGLGDEGKKVNNIYAGTQNYKKENSTATYYGNWLKQTASTIQKFSEIRYIRVVGDTLFVPPELEKLKNLEHITLEDFFQTFPN